MNPQEIYYTCPKCRSCVVTGEPELLPSCPSYEEYGFFTYSAGGKFKIARGIVEGRIELDEEVAEAVYRCTLCGSCNRCVIVKNPHQYFSRIRREYVQKNGVFPKHKALVESLKTYDNPWRQSRGKRAHWAKNLKLKKISKEEVLFYVGCTSSYDPILKELALSLARIMDKAGISFGILGKQELCCGSIALRIGHQELFEKFARRNIEIFNCLPAKIIVTGCAGCFKTLKQDYPEVGELKAEVIHSTQMLERMINENKISLQPTKLNRVTYHDPCHLGRHCQVFDPPRKIISSIPEVELIEMKRNREDSWCCGAGAGVRMAFPQFASHTAQRRYQDAQATGAQALISACPFCEQNLRENFTSLDIMDITQLVELSIK